MWNAKDVDVDDVDVDVDDVDDGDDDDDDVFLLSIGGDSHTPR